MSGQHAVKAHYLIADSTLREWKCFTIVCGRSMLMEKDPIMYTPSRSSFAEFSLSSELCFTIFVLYLNFFKWVICSFYY